MRSFKKKQAPFEVVKQYFGTKIYFGPFSGLRIPEQVYSRLSLTEKLGLYESCLHPCFSALLNRNIRQVMVVGGNYGYYAAGLSYILKPDVMAVFETVASLHPQIASWAEANALPAFDLFGAATEEIFANWVSKTDLILMDCEGYEFHLLDAERFSWQTQADIIVELHPFYEDNLLGTIARRFEKTHDIGIIYDDFSEDDKVQKILSALPVAVAYSAHPTHRWIMQDGQKLFTSGLFLFLKRKHYDT